MTATCRDFVNVAFEYWIIPKGINIVWLTAIKMHETRNQGIYQYTFFIMLMQITGWIFQKHQFTKKGRKEYCQCHLDWWKCPSVCEAHIIEINKIFSKLVYFIKWESDLDTCLGIYWNKYKWRCHVSGSTNTI